jgi:hypothetical protein
LNSGCIVSTVDTLRIEVDDRFKSIVSFIENSIIEGIYNDLNLSDNQNLKNLFFEKIHFDFSENDINKFKDRLDLFLWDFSSIHCAARNIYNNTTVDCFMNSSSENSNCPCLNNREVWALEKNIIVKK